LVSGKVLLVSGDASSGVIVKPEAAARQAESEASAMQAGSDLPRPFTRDGTSSGPPGDVSAGIAAAKRLPTRFHGSVTLDSARVGRDAGRIADEIVSHLAGLVGSNIRVVLELDASIPSGASDEIVRIVTENARTLKFESQGFETD
jgi:hypothetical protein